MVNIIIIFLVAILALIILLAIAVSRRNNNNLKNPDVDPDAEYFDEDGHHKYYDRSIIEKKEFARMHPEEPSPRTLRRLFSRKH